MGFQSRIAFFGWTALALLASSGCPSPSEPAKSDALTETQSPGQAWNSAVPSGPENAAADATTKDVSAPISSPAPAADPLTRLPLETDGPAAKRPDLQDAASDRPIARFEPATEPERLSEEPLPVPSEPCEPTREPSPEAKSPEATPHASETVAVGTTALAEDEPIRSMFQRHELPRAVADAWDPGKRGPAAFEPKPKSYPTETEPTETKPIETKPADKPVMKNGPVAEKSPSTTPSVENDGPAPTAEKSRPRPGKKGGPPFDPIKENGPIFVGWPKPKVALVLSGRQDGYIEPCGCAGLDRMKGGMSRRYSLYESLRTKGWPVVGLDVGGISKGFGRQAELKFHTMIEGMRKTGFDAVGLGTNELQLPAADLVSVAACADGQQGLFVSANVGLFGFAADVTPKVKFIKAGGITIGVTSILGTKYQKLVRNDEIEMRDPAAALAEVLVDMKKKADYLVLLSYATRDESEKLAAKFPEFNLVVSAGDAAEPPSKPALVGDTKNMLIEVGEKGMCAVVVGLYDDPLSPVRYQRVPLDSRFPPSDEMKALMRAYQDQLKTLGFAGLNIRSVPHPQAELNGAFVGSKKCEACHEKSCIIWRRSLHSKAYETLAKLDPPRQFDPECISCHVIGWHPTRHFPYEGGYRSLEATPDLIDVGCETCHGPGEAHCNAEMGKDVALQKKLRQAVVITKDESEKRQCYTCHDLDNSPTFDFKTYWPFIEHKEKEEE